jgi:hypothetical protein
LNFKTWDTEFLKKTEACSLISLPTGAFESWTFPHFGNFSGKFISCLSTPVKPSTELLQNRRLGQWNVRDHLIWCSQLASSRAWFLWPLVYLWSWTVNSTRRGDFLMSPVPGDWKTEIAHMSRSLIH